MAKFIKSVAAAALLATSATGVQAASLSTDVDVQLPSIIALYCYDSVSVNVGAAGLEAALGAGPTAANLGASAQVTSLTQDLGATSATAVGAMASSVDLNLNNVCAFRALVANGVDVVVTQPADSKLMNGTAFIDAAGITLASGNTTDSVNTGLGLGVAATPISVVVPLELQDATTPGSYVKAGLFTITVTGN